MTWQDQSFLGAGELYIDVFDAGGNSTGELDVGNATDFMVRAPELETSERLDMQPENFLQAGEVRTLVRAQELGFTLSDINRDNLAMGLAGSASDIIQAAGDNTATPESVAAFTDRWSKLIARNLDPANPPVVKDDTGTTTYVENSDYEIDYQVGRIKALASGSISDGDSLHAGCTWLAFSGWQVSGDTRARITAALRLVGRDIANDRDCEVIVHKAFLVSSGDIAWLGSEMASLMFTGRILAAAAGTWQVLFT